MAKKKINSAKKNNQKVSNSSKDSMVSKVEIREKRESSLSRLIGTLFIVFGLLLIGYGIFSYIKNNKNPQLDESLSSPSIADTVTAVNGENMVVKGIAEGFKNAQVYIDNELVGTAKIGKDGNFEFIQKIEDEGKYIVSVSAIKGFLKKIVTPKSDPIIVSVDRTAPELSKINYSKEVGTETFALSGEAEPGSKVVVKRGTDIYEAEVGNDGKFVLKDISLREEGSNVFSVVLKDEAGNSKEVEEKVSVVYSKDSSVNGNAVIDSDLPVAAGELQLALSILKDGQIMGIIGILALIAFLASSGIVIYKKNRLQ